MKKEMSKFKRAVLDEQAAEKKEMEQCCNAILQRVKRHQQE